MSPLRKVLILIKRIVLDEIFIFRDSLMPDYQRIEKNENIAERNFFDFHTFRSGLEHAIKNNEYSIFNSLLYNLNYS